MVMKCPYGGCNKYIDCYCPLPPEKFTLKEALKYGWTEAEFASWVEKNKVGQ